ncbi:MAG TPA: NAD(P)H-binding protein [Thermoleophilaceae bacterium]|nr:NAD(P)H-binding protein [Thermoleophilaceae bacterium]
MIAVTGATGELGGRVAARLAEHRVDQRLVVRDRSRAPDLPGPEVAGASDHAHVEAMRTALRGAESVYLVSAGEHPDGVWLHRAAVDAAVAAGLGQIVYVSYLGAAPDAMFTFARDHFHTEEHIRQSGLPFTFLRSSMYLDFMPLLVSDGVIRGPAGGGRIAPVARDDLADAAVAVLLAGGEHDGRRSDLTGPDPLTVAQIAERMGASYVEETLEEARASRAPTGAPDWEIEGWMTSYAAIATGEMDVVTDAVLQLSGHEPITLEAYLAAYSSPESQRVT